MKLLSPILLFSSAIAMAAPIAAAFALPGTGIEQFPSKPSTTLPTHEVIEYRSVTFKQLPESKVPQPSDTNGTYIAPSRTIYISPGGNPLPWRDSSGRFAGSNPFGSAPRKLY